MLVMGVDPGSREAGYGVVEMIGNAFQVRDFGVVRARPGDAVPLRLRAVFQGVLEVMRQHRPDVVSVEQVFYGKSVTSALRMGEGRGVVLLAAALEDIPIVEYAPAVVKKAAVGRGRATKGQVQEMVRILLGLPKPPDSEHAADALALAVCHCHRSKFDDRLPPELARPRGRSRRGPGRRT